MGDRFPFSIPTGWFCVANAASLGAGDVKPLHYFDTHLVLFRDEDGVARVFDAFCPHLGAHLGFGGVVENGRIRCPFHAWEFDGSGTCRHIPYSEKIPKKAVLKPWEVREHAGMILVWHDQTGAPPAWEPPAVPEYESEGWSDYVQLDWTVQTCNQEMAENAVDAAHFCYLHGTAGMPTTRARMHDHLLHVESDTRMTTPAGEVEGRIDVHCYGFGFTLTRFTGIVETLLVSSATPIDKNSCVLWFNFTVKKFGGADVTAGIGRAFVKEIARQLEQDIPVWENKAYLNRPLLVNGDGPIGIFRTWARQFYPAR
jgi:3-ketosteroid 9alpha-monooxygenase subunit A